MLLSSSVHVQLPATVAVFQWGNNARTPVHLGLVGVR